MHESQTEELKNNPYVEKALGALESMYKLTAIVNAILSVAHELALLRKEVKSQSSGIKRMIKRS